MAQTKTLLVASDGSETARRAAGVAGELARALGATVSIVIVQDEQLIVPNAWGIGDFPAGPPAGWLSVDEVRNRLEAGVEEKEFPETERALGELSAPATRILKWGHPASEILAVADEIGADHIVIGSRGRGGFERMLLGSVSQAVATHAKVPVTIVH